MDGEGTNIDYQGSCIKYITQNLELAQQILFRVRLRGSRGLGEFAPPGRFFAGHFVYRAREGVSVRQDED